MSLTEAETIPTQFSHSVKIEQSAKGARTTVHVNANNGLKLWSNPSIFTGLQSVSLNS
jgi:hypothetical protein